MRALLKEGFDPINRPIQVDDVFIEFADAPRSGRPKSNSQSYKKKVIAKVHYDRFGREKTCADIAGELSGSLEGLAMSPTTI